MPHAPRSQCIRTVVPGPVDNPEEIDLDMGDECDMDEDTIPDDDPKLLPDPLFSPVEISTYSTADAAAAAQSPAAQNAAGLNSESRSSADGIGGAGIPSVGARRGLSAALAGLPSPSGTSAETVGPINPEEIELTEE